MELGLPSALRIWSRFPCSVVTPTCCVALNQREEAIQTLRVLGTEVIYSRFGLVKLETDRGEEILSRSTEAVRTSSVTQVG